VRKSTIYFFALVVVGIICCAMMIYYVHQHERIHQIIYKDYGINSSVSYQLSLTKYGGLTIAEDNDNKCNDTCQLAHEQNEIVGYYFEILAQIIFALAFLFIFMKFLIQSEDEINEINNNLLNEI
jgi:TM2 domain-containing membrane protein YozV